MGLKVLVSLVNVESDFMFFDEVRVVGEDEMRKGGVEYEVKVYFGVLYGEIFFN